MLSPDIFAVHPEEKKEWNRRTYVRMHNMYVRVQDRNFSCVCQIPCAGSRQFFSLVILYFPLFLFSFDLSSLLSFLFVCFRFYILYHGYVAPVVSSMITWYPIVYSVLSTYVAAYYFCGVIL